MAAPRITSKVKVWDDFDRPDGALGSASSGGAYKGNPTFFGIASGAAVKTSGTAAVRYLVMLACSVADVVLDATIRTSPTTNTTDTGLLWRSLDSPSTRGGQLYLSIRKTASANSLRLLHRSNTSGSDTVLAQNTTAGLADATTYNVRVVQSGKDVTVYLDGVSKLTATLSDPVHAALTGTDVGFTMTNTDAGSRVEDFYTLDPAMSDVPAAPVATPMRVIVHRGTTGAAATEEKEPGLSTVPSFAHGVEVDARLASNSKASGVVVLSHDDNALRVTGQDLPISTSTVEQLLGAGLTDLDTYLRLLARKGWRDILVQHYTANTVSDLTPIVRILNASPLRDRIVLMTSASAGASPGFAAIRGAGWTRRVGCYGITAANLPTYASAMSTYGCSIAFLPPGDSVYTANRSAIPALRAAGLLVGASTVNTPETIAQAVADGVDYLLTDNPAALATGYTLTPNDPPPGYVWTRYVAPGEETPLTLQGVWTGSSVVAASLSHT